MVRNDYNQSEMVFRPRDAIVIVGMAIALAEVEKSKAGTEIEIEIEIGFAFEKMVMKDFCSDVDKVQVRLPTSLNSKQMQMVAKVQV